jgi:hypothetical protein
MASGNIDALTKQLKTAQQEVIKAEKAIQDAATALLDITDTLTEAVSESVLIGGRISQVVPSHLKVQISNLTQQANTLIEQNVSKIKELSSGSEQSSLSNLIELIDNMPYRDIKPKDVQTKRAEIASGVNLNPDTSQGPQSQQLSEDMSLEEYYGNMRLRETVDEINITNPRNFFSSLRETGVFGQTLDPEMMSFTQRTPAVVQQVRKSNAKLQETINNDEFEDKGEQLQEAFDFKNFKSPGIGSFGSALNFGTIGSGTHTVGDAVI